MPRTLKNTRIKWLTPRQQLKERDSVSCFATGSFDDQRTLLFQSHVKTGTTGVAMPSGLPTGNQSLYRVNSGGTLSLNEEMNSDIVVTGVVRKGVGDSFLSFAPSGSITPFKDDGLPAVDGLSINNPFFATGSKVSDVGEGFDQPLWSKTKFEIDLTPAVSHSFYIENYTSASNSYPMAYWNKTRKVWEGVGAGKEFGLYTAANLAAYRAFCEDQCIGFSYGINAGGSGPVDATAGVKVSNFGFPYHVKYHATSSNTIAMSDYIKSPFLLEKVVLEWSGSLEFNNTFYGTVSTFTVCTFFILNQRRPFKYEDAAAQSFVYTTADFHTNTLVTGAIIPSSYNGGTVQSTIRDLVTFAQVTAFGDVSETTLARVGREKVVYNEPLNVDFRGGWRGRVVMSGAVKSALPSLGLNVIHIGANNDGWDAMKFINKNSPRSGLFLPTGRDLIGSFGGGQLIEKSDDLVSSFTNSTDPTGSVYLMDTYSKPNPYLLLPQDQLVFGWQLPIPSMVNSTSGVPQFPGKGLELTFAPLPSKITFYGSMVSEGKESHNTLNQPLNSMAIHEEIE